MFTSGAFILGGLLAWAAGRANEKDRNEYDRAPLDLRQSMLLLHLRQDMKLVAFLLGGVILMLGVIADRLR